MISNRFFVRLNRFVRPIIFAGALFAYTETDHHSVIDHEQFFSFVTAAVADSRSDYFWTIFRF